MIALTETATTKVKELIAAEGQSELYLRVAVRPGGCSGLSYEMFFATEKTSADLTESYGAVQLLVDPDSAPHLVGAAPHHQPGLPGPSRGTNSHNRPTPYRTRQNQGGRWQSAARPGLGGERSRRCSVCRNSRPFQRTRPCRQRRR